METGTVSKPMVSPPAVPARADQLAAAGAVRTDLRPEAAVQQADDAPATRFAPSQGADFRAAVEAALRDVVERHITVDPRSRELVFQAVSRETGVVVRQVPDESLLRLRAYLRDMREAEDKERGGSDVRRVERIA